MFRKQSRGNVARRTYVFHSRTVFICLSRYEERREGRDNEYRDRLIALTSSAYRSTSAIEFV